MTNDFKAFAAGVGANVITQAEYEALGVLIANGFQSGTALSERLNKVWRQSTIMAAILGQFIVDETGEDALDDGTTDTLLSNLKDGVGSILERTTSTVGGTANAITATYTRPPTVYKPGVSYFVRASTSNTTAVTFTPNPGTLAAKNVSKLNNLPLSSGDVSGDGHWLEFIYDSVFDQYILMNPSTGAQQIQNVPSGSVFWFAQTSAPAGYLKANGAAVSRTTYASLFAALVKSSTATISIASPGVVTWNAHGLSANDPVKWTSTGSLPTGYTGGVNYYVVGSSISPNTFQLSATPGGAAINTSGGQSGIHTAINAPHGDGDGSTTFNIPDIRGEFIRGWDDSRGVDVDRSFGSAQADEIESHNHSAVFASGLGQGAGGGAQFVVQGGGTTGSTGGTETRPRNVALLACIKV